MDRQETSKFKLNTENLNNLLSCMHLLVELKDRWIANGFCLGQLLFLKLRRDSEMVIDAFNEQKVLSAYSSGRHLSRRLFNSTFLAEIGREGSRCPTRARFS